MARNQFGFEKQQRELSKERKKEAKRQRKLDRQTAEPGSEAAETEGEDPGGRGEVMPNAGLST